MIVLLLAPVVGLVTRDRERRRAAALFAAAGWLLALGAVATASGNVRYILPAYGPLAAAAAIGLAGRFQKGRSEGSSLGTSDATRAITM